MADQSPSGAKASSMNWIVVTIGMKRNYAFGPFKSKEEAQRHIDLYLQDYKCEILIIQNQ